MRKDIGTACAVLALGMSFPVVAQSPYDLRTGPGGQGWTVAADPSTEFSNMINSGFRRRNAPIFLEVVEFKITRADRANDSDAYKRELVDNWVGYLSDIIEENGIFAADPARMPPETKRSMEQMRENLMRSIPYGMRDQAASFGRLMPMLIDETPTECINGDGAYGAFLLSFYPGAMVRSEYGSIVLMLIGMGDCGPYNSRARRKLESIKTEAAARFSGDE